jgi:nucleoside-diphosphate-sugar epimerase
MLMKCAIVTGSTGFIGSHLMRRLQSDGVNVTGLARSHGFDILKDDLPLANVDHVYHLAGLTFVPRSWEDPVSFHEVNAHGTIRMLDQCRQRRVPVTYISAFVYGVPEKLPVSERMPARPNSPYAFSKLAAENACRFFAEVYGAQVAILRPFNVYGPGQSDAFLVPSIARQVLDPTAKEIVVASLAPRRDFVYIADVVEALVQAPALPNGQPFNVGSGRSYSVEDVVKTSLACAGVSKPYRGRGETRHNEILDVVADISALENACSWRPKVDFASGIRCVIESLQ